MSNHYSADRFIKERHVVETKLPVWKSYYQKWMYFWAIGSHTFLLLQALEIYQEKNAESVSLSAYIVYVLSSLIWLGYAALVLEPRNKVMMISAVTGFSMGIVILVGISLYKDTNEKTSEERSTCSCKCHENKHKRVRYPIL
jgi:uncharacterized protein with PQ loop repeat